MKTMSVIVYYVPSAISMFSHNPKKIVFFPHGQFIPQSCPTMFHIHFSMAFNKTSGPRRPKNNFSSNRLYYSASVSRPGFSALSGLPPVSSSTPPLLTQSSPGWDCKQHPLMSSPRPLTICNYSY